MTDTITLTGVVATPPRSLQTASGLSITSFRLASSQRRYDRSKSEWVDADTNWYTITAFRQLADNVTASLFKGDRVVVSGRLRIREWEKDDRSGTAVEVDADAVGHDLHWGRSSFVRTPRQAPGEPQSAQDPVHPQATPGDSQPSPAPDPAAPDLPAPDPAAPDLPAPDLGAAPALATSAPAAAWGGPLGSAGTAPSTASTASLSGDRVPPPSPPSIEEWHSGDTETPF